jgi:hypothetical protein
VRKVVLINSGTSILSFSPQNISVYNASVADSTGSEFSPVNLSGILGLQSVYRESDGGLRNSFFENLRIIGQIAPSPEFSFALSSQVNAAPSPNAGESGG